MKPLIPILIKEHKKDCALLDEAMPWSFIPLREKHNFCKMKVYQGTRSGQPHAKGRHKWFLILCNDPSCSAEVRVPEEWILLQIQSYLDQQEADK